MDSVKLIVLGSQLLAVFSLAISKSFIDPVCLDKNTKPKCGQILCAHKHCFLMPGHI